MNGSSKLASTMNRIARPLRCERGQIIIVAALLTPLLIGFTGLALDVGLVMVHRTQRQRTADAAALAGAQYLMYNLGTDSVETIEQNAEQIACTYAQKNGFAGGTCAYDTKNADAAITVNLPPQSGPHKDDHSFVEVKVTRSDPTLFIRVLGIPRATVVARAVGGATPAKRNYALVVLDKTQCDAFSTSSSIAINGGGMIDDSAGTSGGSCVGESANQSGGSVITAQTCFDKSGAAIDCKIDYNSTGKWSTCNNCTTTPPPTKAPLFPDPLSCNPLGSQAHVGEDYCPRPVPCSQSGTPTGCVPKSADSSGTANNTKLTQPNCNGGEVILHPGTYYGGLKLTAASCNFRFSPGIYVFAGSTNGGNGGGFTYSSGNVCGLRAPSDPVTSCPVATDITFFNTGDPYVSNSGDKICGSYEITGSGVLKLAAPTVRHSASSVSPRTLAGYKNMLIWQDDSCTSQFKFAGSSSGSTWTNTGIMYLPSANMKVTGGGNFGSVQIITKTFTQGGSQTIQINFTRYIDTDTQNYKLVE